MGKQLKGWTPPADAEYIDAPDPVQSNGGWTPPADAEPVEVKKKEATESVPVSKDGTRLPGSGDSSQPAGQPAVPTVNPWEALGDIIESTSGPVGRGLYDAGRRIASGFTDDIPKSIAQGLEVAKSSVSPLNVQEYIRNNKPADFQRFVREKENIPFYKSFGDEGFQKYLPKYANQFMEEFGLQDIAAKIKKNEPKVIERRLQTEKIVQEQNKDAAEKLSGTIQSYKNIKSISDFASYIGSLGGQAIYQIPLSILTKGGSSLIQESATIYDQQLDNIASDNGISREEVIKRGLDKPAEGQAYAVLAASLDRLSAGNILKAFKVGGGSIAAKWAKTAIPEALTEPIQGVLEDVGAATGSKLDALSKAVTSSKRIDELVGGVVGGSVGVVSPSGKSTSEVIQDQKNAVDTSKPESVAAAAETIQQSFNQEQNAKIIREDQGPVPSEGEVSQRIAGDSRSDIQQTPEGQPGIAETEQQTSQITDDKGTYNFSGVRERISQGEETTSNAREALREQILNSPEDLRWNPDGKVTILTEKGSDMLRQYQELKQQKPTTNEQTTTPEQLVAQPPDVSQQEPVGSRPGGPVLQDDTGTAPTENQPQVEGAQQETPMEQPSAATQQPPSPVAQVEGTPTGENAGSYVFSRPVQPVPEPTVDTDTGPTEPSAAATPQEDSATGGGPPVLPPAPTISGQARPGVPGERATVVKLQEQSTLTEPLKKGIEDFKNYQVKKQSLSQQRAQNYIKRKGEDQALQDAISFSFAQTSEEKMALLSELANVFSTKFKAAEKQGDQNQVDQNYGKFMTAMNTLSNHITDTAQALSYLNLVGTIFETKAGAVRFAKNQIEQSREGALRTYAEMKMTAEELIKQFDALSKEDFLKSKQVQDLISELKAQSPKSSKVRQAEKNLSSAADRVREAIKAYGQQAIMYDPKSEAKKDVELTKALVGYIKALVQKLAIEAGEKIQNVRDQVVQGVKDFGKEIGLTMQDADVDNLVDDTITREFEKKYKGDIRDAVKEYVEKKSGREELIQRIIDTEGITPEQAQTFTNRFIGIFDEYISKEKQKLVKRFTPKTRKPRAKRTEFYDKVIKLSNAGAVTDEQLDDAIANVFGLPEMTPEIVSQIESMVEEINAAPEGRFKNIAITRMTDYIAKQQKFNVSDYLLASFRAGIFSGIDTQALNLMGNFSNVLELGFMMSLTNPMVGARFIGSVRNPTSIARAGLEALEVLRTGFDPRVAGDARRRALEHSPRSFFGIGKPLEGWRQALDPTLEQQKKYVFRALSAGDLLFTYGINDALQNEMYNRRAKEMGLRGKERTTYIREQMGFTPEKISAALDQANNEALAGQIPNEPRLVSLRAKEIIEQQRDPDIVAKSREYAQAQIMTNTPGGYIGIIMRAINSVIQKIPVLAGMLPVVNFAGNAMRRAVQYVPPAALARGMGHYLGRMGQGESLSTIIKDDLHRLKSGDLEQEMRLRRFMIGTVSLALMMALLDEDDETGENWISGTTGKTLKIHGFGPGTKINRQKNYQFQESGWKPYSIQVGDTYIPYKNYPGLNIILATYGEYADAKRYGKLEKKDALNRLAFAMGNSFAVIAEMGFLTSLNDFLDGVLSGDVNKFARMTSRAVGGFMAPKFQRNIINLFDDRVFSGRDIQEIGMRSIPILPNVAGEPIVNALGEDVRVNWWERIELWSEEGRSAYKPIWSANVDKNYYFSVPTKGSLEETFERTVTTAEYNQFFKLRGAEIIKEFKPEFAELTPEQYSRKMDKVTEIAKYRALVAMGVMETDLMKEIRFQLDDIMEIKRQSQQLKQEIK